MLYNIDKRCLSLKFNAKIDVIVKKSGKKSIYFLRQWRGPPTLDTFGWSFV